MIFVCYFCPLYFDNHFVRYFFGPYQNPRLRNNKPSRLWGKKILSPSSGSRDSQMSSEGRLGKTCSRLWRCQQMSSFQASHQSLPGRGHSTKHRDWHMCALSKVAIPAMPCLEVPTPYPSPGRSHLWDHSWGISLTRKQQKLKTMGETVI